MPNVDPQTAADRACAEVRGLLAKHRTRQSDVAAWLGLSQPAVARRLSGQVAFALDELAILAKRLDVPLASLADPPAA